MINSPAMAGPQFVTKVLHFVYIFVIDKNRFICYN